MGIRIELTRKQYRQLRRHFEAVNFANFTLGRKGALLAQIHEDHGSPYMNVRFFSSEYGPKLQDAIRGDLPYGFGIPAESESHD